MSRKLLRLTEQFKKEPLLISQQGYDSIAEYLDTRNSGSFLKDLTESATLAAENLFSEDSSGMSHTPEGAAVMQIEGPLTYKNTGFEALCGGVSYTALLEQAREAAANPHVPAGVLLVDSGGGEAFGMMETSRQIKELFNKAGKPLLAYVDGVSASAAYGLSVAADEIIMNPESRVGSIGVVVHMQNNAEQKKKAGIKDVFVYAGDSKIPFDEDGEFTEAFLANMQESVDNLYKGFTQHIADSRGISVESVVGTQAKVFDAAKALELGLVDKVMTRDEFDEYLTSVSSPNKEANMGLFNNKQKESLEAMSDTPDMSVQMSELQDKMASMTALLEASQKAEADAKAELSAIVASEATAKMSAKVGEYAFLSEVEGIVRMAGAINENSCAVMFSCFDAAAAAIATAEAKTVEAVASVEEAATAEATEVEAEAALDNTVEDNAEMFTETASKLDEASLSSEDEYKKALDKALSA